MKQQAYYYFNTYVKIYYRITITIGITLLRYIILLSFLFHFISIRLLCTNVCEYVCFFFHSLSLTLPPFLCYILTCNFNVN